MAETAPGQRGGFALTGGPFLMNTNQSNSGGIWDRMILSRRKDRDIADPYVGEMSEPFPYDEIDRNLAAEDAAKGRVPASNDETDTREAADIPPEFAELWSELWAIMVDQILPPPGKPVSVETVGIRTLALIHWVSPGAFGPEGGSMKQLAEKVGITRQCLSLNMKRLAKTFNYSQTYQKDAHRVQLCREAALRMHARKKGLAALAKKIAKSECVATR